MATVMDSIRTLRATFDSTPNAEPEILAVVQAALARANQQANHNTYLWRDPSWTLNEARGAAAMPPADRSPLWGIPVSVKDCFDLTGSKTSCGTFFYRDLHGAAARDSWMVARLREAGAVITGKTHLHPLAYGVTGENAEFRDCLLPGDAGALTGGSSSGAAASVLEGSAMAAIGTDTGGSVRVPAALCGLAGYRASLGRGDWRGGAHLAESFDTLGWLFRDLQDGPSLGALFGLTDAMRQMPPSTVAIVSDAFLQDCEPPVVASLRRCQVELEAVGVQATTVEVDWWSESREIFAPIQAAEAARTHHGHFGKFEDSIRQRLEWGAGLTQDELAHWRHRHLIFRERMDELLAQYELILLPAAPIARLAAGADHRHTRTRLLRYTTPVSLAGMPAVTIPFFENETPAGGMQLVAARDDDARLLAITATLGQLRRGELNRPRRYN